MAVSLRGITKRFGPVLANDDVSFDVARGTIHGIIGENGAGKSTVMSILYGLTASDGGEILIDGRTVTIARSADAIGLGIGMVHQHFMLVDSFSVLENLVLGVEGGWRLSRGLDTARARVTALTRTYGLELDLDALVGDLPVGLRQRVEILKALYRGAHTLVLDEPTGVLTPDEADQLFEILRTLRAEGKTVLLITHKLREIMAVTDRVTVMRAGRVVAEVATADTSREALAVLMVGRALAPLPGKREIAGGPAVLATEGLSVTDAAGIRRVDDLTLSIRAGEIVGIAGVSGNGQSELLAALAGTLPIAGGRVMWRGQPWPSGLGPRDRRRQGLAHIPEDRLRMGLIGAFHAYESAILGYQDDPDYSAGPLLRTGRICDETRRRMSDYDVRPADVDLRSALFSGGNQQKLISAREMERAPAALLVGQPTRGVDIGAIDFIHRRLIALRDRGTAILLVSVELEEILALADRILVMVDGRVVGEVSRADATEQALGLLMAGVRDVAA
ncbi:MAG TPA: ABC transporter ATP-binding protein [Stellaceae bacterium]|nr:ABC transporter ATP-binding protein [Stellaceae bacterium]